MMSKQDLQRIEVLTEVLAGRRTTESAAAVLGVSMRQVQRVSHTAIVENKRLGQALALVKAQQDLKRTTKVMTNSEKTGYKKDPRAIYGPDFVEKTRSHAAVEMPVYGKPGRGPYTKRQKSYAKELGSLV